MKIVLTEDELLGRILRAVAVNADGFYEGPKLQAAAHDGSLEVYFSDLDGEMCLVLSIGDPEEVSSD